MNALISLADIAALALLLAVVSIYTQQGGKMPGWLPLWTYKESTAEPVFIFLIFFGLKNVAAYFIYHAQSHFVHGVATRISDDQLKAYLNGSYLDYVSVDSSARVHRINHEPVQFAQYILSGIQQIFTEVVLTTMAVLAILLFNAKLFVLLVIFLVPPVLIVGWLTKRRLRNIRTHVKEDAEKTTQYLQEALNGYIESNMYDRQDFFTKRHHLYQSRLDRHLSELQVTQWLPSRVIEVFAIVGLFILVLLNNHNGHTADVISIGAFMAAAYKIIPGIVRIANLSAQVKTYEHTIKDLQAVAITEEAITKTNGIKPITAAGFSHVSFMHPGNNVLQDFSLKLNAGDFVDLIAPSGKGKTTLINLLMGFLSPDLGHILINHSKVDITTLHAYRSRMAYVKQQTFLIHDTIRRNITLEEHTANELRFKEAIRIAGLETLINSFEEKEEKIISDSGKNISGGQRKRIAIARALYKEADMIILDEPFSELDEASERALLEYFKELAMRGKIIILITHNRISAGYCNKTVTLHE